MKSLLFPDRDVYDGAPWTEGDLEDLRAVLKRGGSIEDAAKLICRQGSIDEVRRKAAFDVEEKIDASDRTSRTGSSPEDWGQQSRAASHGMAPAAG